MRDRFHAICLVSLVCGLGMMIGCAQEEGSQDLITKPADPGAAPAAANGDAPERSMGIETEPYGQTSNGTAVDQYLLTNAHGITMSLITYGAIVTSINVPDRDGNQANVVLGFDTLEGYLTNAPYFGAICGRYANRIAAGKFTLDGTEYTLATNNAPNHLHGGIRGFDKVVWHAEPIEDTDSVGVRFTYVSADGKEGYPGELKATVVYSLTNSNEMRIDYTATSNQATPINLTNHCYWNLAGGGDVLGHQLQLHCSQYLPVDDTLIPTGQRQDVAGTPMDFTSPKAIGAQLADVEGGYDHCYVFGDVSSEPKLIARLEHPGTGRVMEILTTEPGVQLYTGNFLDGSAGTGGFQQHEGLCLECQHFPDSPNQPDFPTTILQPAEVYRQTTIHRFSVAQ